MSDEKGTENDGGTEDIEVPADASESSGEDVQPAGEQA